MRIAPAPLRNGFAPDHAVRRWVSGIGSLDAALGGGLAFGRVHEVYAGEADDAAAASGFVAALVTGMSGGDAGNAGKAALWLRSRRCIGHSGVLQANGWAELGGAPGACLFGVVSDHLALLRAGVDALRCNALSAVIVESRGRMAELDLTASRRFALAAEHSGVPLFLLRMDAEPVASAAQTRWQVAAAPSRALAGQAPGLATFDVNLLRQRSGPSGLGWRLEWNGEQRTFRDASASGAVVSVPVRRPAADAGTGALRPIVRRAA